MNGVRRVQTRRPFTFLWGTPPKLGLVRRPRVFDIVRSSLGLPPESLTVSTRPGQLQLYSYWKKDTALMLGGLNRVGQTFASGTDTTYFSASEWYPGPVNEWSGDCPELPYAVYKALGGPTMRAELLSGVECLAAVVRNLETELRGQGVQAQMLGTQGVVGGQESRFSTCCVSAQRVV
jgi:hypothetical protein